MNNRRKINPLVKSSIIYVIANVIGQGMSFAGIVVFTRIMSQADYGNYSTYYAYVALLTVLVGGNLYFPLNNAYIDKKNEIRQFRKSVLALSVLIMLIVMMLVLSIGTFLLGRFSAFIVVMATIHSYGFFLVNYRIYSANMENDYRKKGLMLVFPNFLQFVFALALVLMFPAGGYQARVIGSTAGVAIVGTIVFLELIRDEGDLINREYWKYALSISLPSIAMSLSSMLMQQCDKVMITNIRGADETAVYSVIYYLGYALIAIDQAMSPVRQAWIFRRLDKKELFTPKLTQKWYMFVIAALALGVTIAGPEIIKIMAPEKYWKYEYIPPFVISACLMALYGFHAEVILFYKKNNILSLSVLICAVVNIVLNALFIPKYGALAACYTTIVAYGMLLVITSQISKKCIGGIYSSKYIIYFIMGLTAVSMVGNYLTGYPVGRYILLCGLYMIMIIYAIKKKREWKELLWQE